MKKFKRIIALGLAVTLSCSLFAGCGKKDEAKDGKVTITVGDWPTKEEPNYEIYQEMKEKFEKKYPNIKIKTDEWGYSVNSFLQKAASGQLPSIYVTSYTEIKRIIDTGYAADVTKHMKESGYADKLRDSIRDLISKDGKIYAVPSNAYVMGLYINMNLFKKAGLVNEDGTPKVPKTWEEVAEYSQIIRKKTGQAGFVLPTMGNCGGWHFMNIAWGHGVNKQFMNKKDGKWTTDFTSKEAIDALKYVQDLRWKYNAVPENALMDHNKMLELFATDQAAMFLAAPSWHQLTDAYAMDKDDIAVGSMPAGPAGKYTQMGGELRVLKGGLSEEEIDACFKWLDFTGVSTKLTEDSKESMEKEYIANADANRVAAIKTFSMWDEDGEIAEIEKYRLELIEKHRNTDKKLYADYEDFSKISIVPEPPINCQQLYAALDGCIQKVLSEKNADPEELLKKAASDFQTNYLDKAAY